jgi:hypothetical protein
MFDDVGCNGLALSFGPGAGMSASVTYAWTYTISDFLKYIENVWDYIWNAP